MNNIKIIKTEEEYKSAMVRIDQLLDSLPGSPEEQELDLISLLVEKYEDEHYPIEPPDPIEAILFRMDQQDLSPKDLIPYLGSQSRVSEVLNRKRPLSLTMIRNLHIGLGIPYESLLQESTQSLPDDELVQHNFSKAFFYYSCSHLNNEIKVDELKEWYIRVYEKAQNQKLPCFERKEVDKSLFKELLHLFSYSAGPRMAQEYLNKKGIHIIIQKPPFDVDLDGACFISNKRNPVISLTMRNNKSDDFWFTLLHLLGHLYLNTGEKPIAIFDSIDCIYNKDAPKEETLVNELLLDVFTSSEALAKARQYFKKSLDISTQNEIIKNFDISPELLSCLYRIENMDKDEDLSRSISRKVNDKLEVYNS